MNHETKIIWPNQHLLISNWTKLYSLDALFLTKVWTFSMPIQVKVDRKSRLYISTNDDDVMSATDNVDCCCFRHFTTLLTSRSFYIRNVRKYLLSYTDDKPLILFLTWQTISFLLLWSLLSVLLSIVLYTRLYDLYELLA